MPVYPPANRYDAAIGDGTNATLVITHNLGSRAVNVTVKDAVTFREVGVEWEATSVSTVTLFFSSAPAANTYRITVMR